MRISRFEDILVNDDKKFQIKTTEKKEKKRNKKKKTKDGN